MLKTLSLAAAALTMTAGAIVPAAPAAAQRYYGDRYYDRGYGDNRGYYQDRVYRGDRGYYRDRGDRRCNSGTTGTIVGAIAGGLLGRTIDTRGDRTLGTVLGAGAGALAGRAVERSDRPGYCR
ncbi:glycine zipper 2TM domain-containing protein [Sphingomonas sp. MA1305]|uniref:glycine zipper 2TM domain-containing protein n=1 Tax=Sphingomonas sp. MA1305 TaxID=2479204 RepID=UPI0018DFD617|nr:glycine zipper 2TM domain-containing protein [Sphingomonas sp. MA1305]MBI0475563.1 glycine zipper 2TM domain-containing protein [Sphingomonas sp. MA1305]